MTDHDQPEAELPGTTPPAAERNASRVLPVTIAVLGLAVAVVAGYVAVLLLNAHAGDVERQRLACEVEQLGGRPIGPTRCPPPTNAPIRTTPAPMGTAGPAGPGPTIIVIRPTVAPQPLPAPSAPSRPRSSPATRTAPPSPRATRSSSPPPPPSSPPPPYCRPVPLPLICR